MLRFTCTIHYPSVRAACFRHVRVKRNYSIRLSGQRYNNNNTGKKIGFLNRKTNLLINNIHRLSRNDPPKRIHSVHILRLQNAYYSLNTFFCCRFIPLYSIHVHIARAETSNLFVLPVVYILNKALAMYFFISVNIHRISLVTEKYGYRPISVTEYKN